MISDFYTQTAVILNYSTSTGDYWSTSTGGHWDTEQSIKAAVNLLNSNERYIGDKNQLLADYKMYCAPTTILSQDSRVRWDGDTFDVVEIPKNTLQRDHHLRVLLRRRYV